MQPDEQPFLDNWAYLKTELNWLDRLLSLAIARQRKETKEVNQLSRSPVDRATSHWWKGLISLDETAAYDSPVAKPHPIAAAKHSYQQQLEAKIRASQARGITLGLPLLRDRLSLSLFEKNLVLLALAPEISRRYARLYNYLQATDRLDPYSLLTVDLALRLLCRNDSEWQAARQALAADSTLVRTGLVAMASLSTEPFLAHPIKLAETIVDYLLSDQPDPHRIEKFLQPNCSIDLASVAWQLIPPQVTESDLWAKLILPAPLLKTLRHLGDRLQFAEQVDHLWGFAQATPAPKNIALLVGAPGTGKTLAARAIAQTLQTPLTIIDLATIPSFELPHLLPKLIDQAPSLLLLKSAQAVFGHNSNLTESDRQQFFNQCRATQALILFSIHQKQSLPIRWRQHCQLVLEFPFPNSQSRLQLWQQAFPAQVPLNQTIDWQQLANLPLTGGEINAIAHEAAIFAAAESAIDLNLNHILQAHQLQYSQSKRRP